MTREYKAMKEEMLKKIKELEQKKLKYKDKLGMYPTDLMRPRTNRLNCGALTPTHQNFVYIGRYCTA